MFIYYLLHFFNNLKSVLFFLFNIIIFALFWGFAFFAFAFAGLFVCILCFAFFIFNNDIRFQHLQIQKKFIFFSSNIILWLHCQIHIPVTFWCEQVRATHASLSLCCLTMVYIANWMRLLGSYLNSWNNIAVFITTWLVCVCVYVSVCICKYLCMFVCMYKRLCVYVFLPLRVLKNFFFFE